MVQFLRLFIVTVVVGYLCWLLSKTVVDGIKTGAISHTDSTKKCKMESNPVMFWSLVILFNAIIICCALAWWFVLCDVITKLK